MIRGKLERLEVNQSTVEVNGQLVGAVLRRVRLFHVSVGMEAATASGRPAHAAAQSMICKNPVMAKSWLENETALQLEARHRVMLLSLKDLFVLSEQLATVAGSNLLALV